MLFEMARTIGVASFTFGLAINAGVLSTQLASTEGRTKILNSQGLGWVGFRSEAFLTHPVHYHPSQQQTKRGTYLLMTLRKRTFEGSCATGVTGW